MKLWDNRKYLEEEFVIKGRSTNDIAREHGVFPNQIRRALIKNGIQPRNKSEAQKNNIEKNGAPMTGRKRSTEEKERISSGMQKWWDALSDDQKNEMKERLSEAAKGKWESLSEEEQKIALRKMQAANRTRSKFGSKNENMIAQILSKHGLKIVQRSKDYTPGRRFEIDICLPEHQIAIEWDGPTHFDPIYGEVHLAKVKMKDDFKDSVLISAGWTVFRCRDMASSSSLAFCNRVANRLLEMIKSAERGKVHIIEAV
jgi:very-short-patch-repair endonuclease